MLHPASKSKIGDRTIEPYRTMLEEARRIGMSDTKILDHFSGQRFLMSPAEYEKFLRKLGLGKPSKKTSE